MSDPVYAVAVNTDPLLWVIHCELCDNEFGDPTDDFKMLDSLETKHLGDHGLIN